MQQMFEISENMTLEEFITHLHFCIARLPNTGRREKMINHLVEMKESLLFLECCYNCSSYEPERSTGLHSDSKGHLEDA